MPGLKYSRQRESIINCLKGRKDHPTADMIYARCGRSIRRSVLGRFTETFLYQWIREKFSAFHAGKDRIIMMQIHHSIIILYARNAGLFQICICHRWNISMCLRRMVLTVRQMVISFCFMAPAGNAKKMKKIVDKAGKVV